MREEGEVLLKVRRNWEGKKNLNQRILKVGMLMGLK
jgi:hypothetical protein